MTSVQILNLEKYLNYSIQISASNAAGEGPLTVPFYQITSIDVPTGTVQNLSASAASSTSITVSWTPPFITDQNGPILGYRVSWTRISSAFTDPSRAASGVVPTSSLVVGAAGIFDAQESSIVVSGLEKYVSYTFTVLAYTSAGDGPTATSTAQTLQDIPTGTPVSFGVSDVQPTTVSLVWQAPIGYQQNGPITQYTVFWMSNDVFVPSSNANGSVTVTSATLTYTVSGLQEYVTYQFFVLASTMVGAGPNATVSQLTKPAVPAAAPQNLVVSANGIGQLAVQWSAPPLEAQNGPLMSYFITWIRVTALSYGPAPLCSSCSMSVGACSVCRPASGSSVVASVVVPSSSMAYLITVLENYVVYNITVSAINIVGQGPATYTTGLTNVAAPVGPPLNLFSTSTSTSISLTWDAPILELRNGIIQTYRIEYSSIGETYFTNGGSLVSRTTILPTDVYHSAASFQTTGVFATIQPLFPYQVFNITITASTGAPQTSNLFSSNLTSTTIRTQPAQPAQPPQPIVSLPSTSTCVVSWPSVNTYGGPILIVQLIVEPSDSAFFMSPPSTYNDNSNLGSYDDNTLRVQQKVPTLPYIAFMKTFPGTNASSTGGFDVTLGNSDISGATPIVSEATWMGLTIKNGPLSPSANYSIRLRVFTSSDVSNSITSMASLQSLASTAPPLELSRALPLWGSSSIAATSAD